MSKVNPCSILGLGALQEGEQWIPAHILPMWPLKDRSTQFSTMRVLTFPWYRRRSPEFLPS